MSSHGVRAGGAPGAEPLSARGESRGRARLAQPVGGGRAEMRLRPYADQRRPPPRGRVPSGRNEEWWPTVLRLRVLGARVERLLRQGVRYARFLRRGVAQPG